MLHIMVLSHRFCMPFLVVPFHSGVVPDRMIFTLHHNPEDAIGATPAALDSMASLLTAFGADYWVWLGEASPEGALKATLKALARVPIQDWIVQVEWNEFTDFQGLSAQRFLERSEREVRAASLPFVGLHLRSTTRSAPYVAKAISHLRCRV